jgi:hypothetical protein
VDQHTPRPFGSLSSVRRSYPRWALTLGAALAAVVTATGCVGSSGAVPAAQSEPQGPVVISPPVELHETAVVRIAGAVTCTGTLIADDLVLTAHHCVVARDTNGHPLGYDEEPRELDVELGDSYLPWGTVKVRAVVAPDCEQSWGDGDIAILVLSRHLVGIKTENVRLEADPKRAEPVKISGFGRCAMTRDAIHLVPRELPESPDHKPDDAKKPILIDRVDRGTFAAVAPICPGDSGAPVFVFNSATRVDDIVGVVSASVMDGDEKTADYSVFTRVDVWPQIFSAAQEISRGASPSELPPYSECRPASRSSKQARTHRE